MSRTALVTGGSGYFGSLLLKKLHGRGYACRVFDLNDADDRPDDVEFARGDIRDADAIRKACEGMAVIHHNVAQVPLAKDRELFESVNIDGTRNLLDAARDAGAEKVVYTSSSAVYGVPSSNPVTEAMTPHPREAYGAAKLEGESLCAASGLDVSIIRPRTILGHGRLGIFQILFEWVREGQNIPVMGKGDNVYQFVHADDLAEACLLAGERAGAATYNCGAERYGTMRAVLEHLCAHAKTGSKVKSLPMTPAVLGMKLTSALGMVAVRGLSRPDVRPIHVFRRREGQRRARLEAALQQRGDVCRKLRVVPRQPGDGARRHGREPPPEPGETGCAQSAEMDSLTTLLRVLRPHQWTKNVVCLAGVFFSGRMFEPNAIWLGALTAVAFSLASSSVYIFNDIFDRARDREHPKKRNRPIASGAVSVGAAALLGAATTAASLLLAWNLGTGVLICIGLYFVNNIAYSIVFKHLALFDVLGIAFGFLMRLLAGVYVLGETPDRVDHAVHVFPDRVHGLRKKARRA